MPEARFCALRECRPRRAALEVGGASQRPPPRPPSRARIARTCIAISRRLIHFCARFGSKNKRKERRNSQPRASYFWFILNPGL